MIDMIIQARADFGRSIFREIIITACWIIWTARNDLVFDNKPCSLLLSWQVLFKDEIGLVYTFLIQAN